MWNDLKTLFLICLLLISPLVSAVELRILVVDREQRPIPDAVLTAVPVSGKAPVTPAPVVSIFQKDKEFTPFVTVVPVGTKIEFPNQDSVQHHVFSFSKPKLFDIPLYKNRVPPPVLFDVPGIVIIGCNIHDWMKAYVFVTDTPFFSKTGPDGEGRMALPPNEYQFEVWHPLLRRMADDTLRKPLAIRDESASPLRIMLELKKKFRTKRPATPGSSGGY